MSNLTNTERGKHLPPTLNLKNRRQYKQLKNVFRHNQHEKCAYCECMLNGDAGHIEHYRPTKGYRPSLSDMIIKPGYGWLKNDPDNLLLSCSRCNSVFKGNHFALADESNRNIEGRDVSRERPLLISPIHDYPERYFAYNKWLMIPLRSRGLSYQRALYTIHVLGLNKCKSLIKRRRKVYEHFMDLLKTHEHTTKTLSAHPEEEEICAQYKLERKMIQKMMRSDAEYAGMTRYIYRQYKRARHIRG